MTSNAYSSLGIDASQFPQDPFLPQITPTGPTFLDTGACVCALQTNPDEKNDLAVWQCIGNQTQNVYEATTGKWFNTLHGGSVVDLPIDDASNGPDNSATFRWDSGQNALVKITDESGFSGYDSACTAVNQTVFSTAFYRANDELARNATPIDAAPCYRAGAVPVQIQNLTMWESQGCSEGFLCLLPLLSHEPRKYDSCVANRHQAPITRPTVCRNTARPSRCARNPDSLASCASSTMQTLAWAHLSQ
jgi:hypothetical protein